MENIMASRKSDDEIRKIGESVALGLKDTLKEKKFEVSNSAGKATED